MNLILFFSYSYDFILRYIHFALANLTISLRKKLLMQRYEIYFSRTLHYVEHLLFQYKFAAAQQGKTKYTGVAGDISLRQSIAADLSQRKGTPYSADQIVVLKILTYCF